MSIYAKKVYRIESGSVNLFILNDKFYPTSFANTVRTMRNPKLKAENKAT